jgi:hypothetical protein
VTFYMEVKMVQLVLSPEQLARPKRRMHVCNVCRRENWFVLQDEPQLHGEFTDRFGNLSICGGTYRVVPEDEVCAELARRLFAPVLGRK